MSTIELTDFVTVEAALREKNLKQSLYDAGSLLMERVLVTLHGEEHKQRRMTEMRVFRRDFFRHYEHAVMPEVYKDVMQTVQSGAELNLVDLNYRFMVYLAIAFAGIDRQSNDLEELSRLVRLLRMFGVAATLGQAKDQSNLEQTRAEVTAAIEEFDAAFFTPSVARRRELLDAVARGEKDKEDLPMDVLTVLLQDVDKLELARDMMLRETGFFFLASAHTSVHSLGHAMHHILNWCEQTPGGRQQLVDDPVRLQRFVHESFRLHPSSPIAKRVALAPVTFHDGQTASTGDTVVINLRQANRDEAVFGANPDAFNPEREIKRGIAETGVTFGIGMHACLGKNLAAGALPAAGKAYDADSHQMGTVAWLCHRLLQDGIQADKTQTPSLDQTIERETWLEYPVLMSA